MVSVMNTIDTAHEDLIHDAQLDYYGIRLATCSSDRKVKIFEVRDGRQSLLQTLDEHDGAVWQVAWAHPTFGSILASCGYDKRVVIWQEANGKYEAVYKFSDADSSVNSVSWAPYELGLILAAGSSDGNVYIISRSADGKWEPSSKPIKAHSVGCNSVSWAPASAPGTLIEQPTGQPLHFVKLLASGGCDCLVKLWREENGQWIEDQKLEGHSDWVREVAFAPSIGLSTSTLASCAQDGRVLIWTREAADAEWHSVELKKFDDVVWSVSWSVTGNVLSVAGGDNRVTLWKETPDRHWVCVSNLQRGQAAG